jgi:hypothetical protein
VHACQMVSVPSIYGRRSHLCDMANSLSGHKVLFMPLLLQARHPDLCDMCVCPFNGHLVKVRVEWARNEREQDLRSVCSSVAAGFVCDFPVMVCQRFPASCDMRLGT